MKPRYWIWVVLLILLAVPLLAAQRRYILRAAPADVSGIALRNGLTVVRQLGRRPIFLVTAPDDQSTSEVIQSVKSDPAVVGFELDGLASIPETSGFTLNPTTSGILDALTDPSLVTYFGSSVWSGYLNQPAAGIIRIADAQATYGGGGYGPIAVIDTGADLTHPGLSSSLVSGYDFTRDQAGASELLDLDPTTASILDQSSASMVNKTLTSVNGSTVALLDGSVSAILDTSTMPRCFGHGTMVAGVVHRACGNCKMMPLKAFTGTCTGDMFDILRAIYWATDNGAKVIQMSFSTDTSSDELLAAISYANLKGVISVGSAGNSGLQTVVYPAGYKKVSGVGSIDSSFLVRSLFSNWGNNLCSFAAPGEGIVTFYPYNNYAAGWGTSFSAPWASGGAGLLLQIDPYIKQDDCATSLSQAYSLPGQGLGAGRIDLYRACQYWTLHKSK